MYKKDDKVIFRVGEESFECTVAKTSDNRWYLSTLGSSNSIIFQKLNIADRFKFVEDISHYATSNKWVSFPEIQYSDETEINKVIDALLEKCDEYNKFNNTTTCYKERNKEEKMKESLKTEEKISTETTSQKPSFKEGDYVKVISKKDVKNSCCYRFGFTSDMFRYCGNIYIVHKVCPAFAAPGSKPDDGMLYELKTADGTVLPYNFSSSMLMPYIFAPQLPFLNKLQLRYPIVASDCIQGIINSETKTMLKKSTPEYKLKFTN